MFKPEKPLTMAEIRALPRGATRAIDPDVPGAVVCVPKRPRNAIYYGYRWRGKDGRSHTKSLGPINAITRAAALKLAGDEIARRRLNPGYDPLGERKDDQRARRVAKAGEEAKRTLVKAAADYIAAKSSEWKHQAHVDQWERSLKTYVLPLIGETDVAVIDTPDIRRVLDPIWQTIPETASRVRGRLEKILERERVLGHRSGENPARWGSHLEHVYAKKSAVKRAKRVATGADKLFAALPFADLPAFMADLQAREGVSPRALEVAILAAARTEDVLGMAWDEVDLATRVWTIPAERMKTENEHRVPLTDRVVEILSTRPKVGAYVFYGRDLNAPLEESALRGVLRRMNRTDCTPHGFRSTFDTWAAETQHVPEELREACLAHGKSEVIAAYQRGDLLNKRRHLHEAWEAFALTPPHVTNVTPLRIAG
jgi:integrase